MYGLIVLFKNKDDKDKIYVGDLITNPENVNEHTLYVDCTDCVDFKLKTPDWKNSHITSVSMNKIIYVGTIEKIEEAYPEMYLD
jgi:hypothetical protein